MPRRSNQLLSQGHKTSVFPFSPLPAPIPRCPFHLTGRGCSSLLCETCPCVATIFLACSLHILPTRSPCSCPLPFPHHPTHPTPLPRLSFRLCTLCQLRLACMSLVFMTFESSARSERVPFCFENRYDMKIVKSFSFAAALWAVSDNVVRDSQMQRCSVAAWCWCCHWCHVISFAFVRACLLRNCCVQQATHTHTRPTH